MTITCPSCGHVVNALPALATLADIKRTRHEHSVLSHLMLIYPRPAAGTDLVEAMYRGARMPDGPSDVLRSLMPRLRRRIEAHGWTIVASGSGRGLLSTYRLAPAH